MKRKELIAGLIAVGAIALLSFAKKKSGSAISGIKTKRIVETNPNSRKQYKREFLERKRKWERQGSVFFNKLSDVVDTTGMMDMKVGDMVLHKNDAGITFGPYEILAFGHPEDGRCVYIDSDSFWYCVEPESLTLV